MTATTAALPLATLSWNALASEMKVGDRYRALGRGFLSREITSVTERCNCEGRSRSIDSETRLPLHFPVVAFETREGLSGTLLPHSPVTLTDGY